ncbi:MAG: hypothetical protein NC927_01090 [Candidatus Omnitrophica bacterium]|nr:hypothetical protein [Candidatus Omnitrophota bacterium]
MYSGEAGRGEEVGLRLPEEANEEVNYIGTSSVLKDVSFRRGGFSEKSSSFICDVNLVSDGFYPFLQFSRGRGEDFNDNLDEVLQSFPALDDVFASLPIVILSYKKRESSDLPNDGEAIPLISIFQSFPLSNDFGDSETSLNNQFLEVFVDLQELEGSKYLSLNLNITPFSQYNFSEFLDEGASPILNYSSLIVDDAGSFYLKKDTLGSRKHIDSDNYISLSLTKYFLELGDIGKFCRENIIRIFGGLESQNYHHRNQFILLVACAPIFNVIYPSLFKYVRDGSSHLVSQILNSEKLNLFNNPIYFQERINFINNILSTDDFGQYNKLSFREVLDYFGEESSFINDVYLTKDASISSCSANISKTSRGDRGVSENESKIFGLINDLSNIYIKLDNKLEEYLTCQALGQNRRPLRIKTYEEIKRLERILREEMAKEENLEDLFKDKKLSEELETLKSSRQGFIDSLLKVGFLREYWVDVKSSIPIEAINFLSPVRSSLYLMSDYLDGSNKVRDDFTTFRHKFPCFRESFDDLTLCFDDFISFKYEKVLSMSRGNDVALGAFNDLCFRLGGSMPALVSAFIPYAEYYNRSRDKIRNEDVLSTIFSYYYTPSYRALDSLKSFPKEEFSTFSKNQLTVHGFLRAAVELSKEIYDYYRTTGNYPILDFSENYFEDIYQKSKIIYARQDSTDESIDFIKHCTFAFKKVKSDLESSREILSKLQRSVQYLRTSKEGIELPNYLRESYNISIGQDNTIISSRFKGSNPYRQEIETSARLNKDFNRQFCGFEERLSKIVIPTYPDNLESNLLSLQGTSMLFSAITRHDGSLSFVNLKLLQKDLDKLSRTVAPLIPSNAKKFINKDIDY